MALVPTYVPPGWAFYEFRTLKAVTADFRSTFAPTGERIASWTFDATADGWIYSGGAGGSVARVTNTPAPHDGAGCLRLIGPTAGGAGVAVVAALTGLAPGSTYRVSAWVWMPSPPGLTPDDLTLHVDDGTGANAHVSDHLTNDGWQFAEVDYTVPANGQLRVFLRTFHDSGSVNARIDTVTVVQVGDSRAPVDAIWEPPPYELWLVDSVSWSVNESASRTPGSVFPAPALAMLHLDDPRTRDASLTYLPAPSQIITQWTNVRSGQVIFPPGFRVASGGKLGLFLRWAAAALAAVSPPADDDLGALVQVTVLRDTNA